VLADDARDRAEEAAQSAFDREQRVPVDEDNV
jgi:hypothetical protein